MLTKYPLWVLTNLCASSFSPLLTFSSLRESPHPSYLFPDKKADSSSRSPQTRYHAMQVLHSDALSAVLFGNFLSCLFLQFQQLRLQFLIQMCLADKRMDDTPMTETPDHPYSIQTQCNIPCSTFSDTMQPQIHSLPAYQYQ